LSQMMRYMLYESNDEKVALEKEIQYIEHYIDLQRLRTNSKTRIKWSVSGDPRGKQVVPLIFIPFIENAFKFGVSTVHEGEIVIHLQITDQKLIFWVQNTIPPPSGMQTGTRAGGLGLRNVKKRLKLVYGHAFKLNINEGKEVYKVKLRLPL
ncbi:MAG: histidine kinase, partial [Bacteroidetes bacterium]